MINHGTTLVSPAMDRHCDHMHSSLISRHVTKRLRNILNIHLKQTYMLCIHCQLTKHAVFVQESSCHCNFARTQTGLHACKVLLHATVDFNCSRYCSKWHHMCLGSQHATVDFNCHWLLFLMASFLCGIQASWDLLGDLCHSLQILLTASMLARWHIASPHIL